jgi:hypothetical protein
MHVALTLQQPLSLPEEREDRRQLLSDSRAKIARHLRAGCPRGRAEAVRSFRKIPFETVKDPTIRNREFDSLFLTVEFFGLRIFSLGELL